MLQQEERFRHIFVSASEEWEGARHLFDTPTADHSPVLIAPLPDLPQEVRKHLSDLHSSQEDENSLYEIADAIAEWIEDASEPEQTALAVPILDLPPRGACILVSAFADSEVLLASEVVLRTIASWVYSDDKRLAQAAAACLLECGGIFGQTLLQDRMKNSTAIPHAQLIQGIINFLEQRRHDLEL